MRPTCSSTEARATDESGELIDGPRALTPDAGIRRLRVTLAPSVLAHAALIATIGPSGTYRVNPAPQGEQRIQISWTAGPAAPDGPNPN